MLPAVNQPGEALTGVAALARDRSDDRRWNMVLIWGLVATGLAILAWYLLVPASVPAHPVVDNVIFTVTSGVAAALCFRAGSRAGATGWRLFGFACLAWFAGQLIWNGYVILLQQQPPFPSLADIGYNLFYPFCALGLIRLIREGSAGLGVEVLLDGLIVSTVATLLCYEMLLVRSPLTDPRGPVAILASASWQIGIVALVILGVLALLLHASSNSRWPVAALLAGLISFAIADFIYGQIAVQGTYTVGMPIDLGWHLGFLSVGIGAVLASQVRGGSSAQNQLVGPAWRHAGTLVGVIAFGGLAAFAALDPTTNIVVAIGCVMVAVLVAVRFAYSSQQEQRLALRTRERDRLAAEVFAREATQTEMAAALEAHRVANLELERLNQSKSDFVSVVSHEFRTPLTSIQGFADLLAEETLSDDEVKEFAGIVSANSRRLARMIDDMLDLDRIESGQARSEHTRLDLNEIVTQVAETMQPGSPGHRIRLVLDAALPPVCGDRDQLNQVATNLVANAIKYSPDGGEITVTTSQADDAILLTVQDRGIGIPSAALETIFERFVRAAPSGHRFQGTGLGLSITRRLVELHGGRVWAESPDGAGSAFHVLLPRSEPTATN